MTDSLATPKTAFLFAIGLPLMHAAQPALADDEKTNAEATVVSVLSEQITADTLTPLGMCSTDGGELRMALGWTGPTPKAIEWRTFPQPNPPNRRDPTWMLTLDKDDKVCRSWADPRLIPQGFATNDAGDFLIFGELRSGSPRPEVRLFDKDGGEKWSVNLNEYITGLARNETFEVAGAALHSVGENEFAYLAVNFINRNASPVIVVLKAQDGTQVRQIPTTKTSATHGIVWDGMTKIRQGDQSRVVVYGAFLEASNKIVDGRRAVTQSAGSDSWETITRSRSPAADSPTTGRRSKHPTRASSSPTTPDS